MATHAAAISEILSGPPEILKSDARQAEVPFDPIVLKEKYLKERNKRLNNGGINQYRYFEEDFGHLQEDPYVEPGFTRDPVDIQCDVVIIGGGYGGELVAVRLIEQGINNFRIIEKGGDFGGTWYWNRYPGAQCDIESYIYMPLLEEIGHMPTEKYARSNELFAHAKAIGTKYELYSRALFQTVVNAMHWNDSTALWKVETSRGDKIRTRFVIPIAGPLHRPKLPGIPGLETFKGHSFHSSRWDYDYSAGDSSGGLDKLADKRVGIIGTGATAVQIVPHLGKWAKELYVFQRTPSSIDVRNNRPTDQEWFRSFQKGWQRSRMENFTTIVSGGYQEVDTVQDGWTDIFRSLFAKSSDNSEVNANTSSVDPAERIQFADFKKMEAIRARIDEVVEDRQTAESLKPWYNQLCKRPCFHDEYLQTFNLPNVQLVDTMGNGVSAITDNGVVANGIEYPLDCIIYATGFDLATNWSDRSGVEIYGRNGRILTEKWHEGASTFHGWTTRDFPNCFFATFIQAAMTANFIHHIGEQAIHLAYVISECQKRSICSVEPTVTAEEAWVNTIIEKGELRAKFISECTPGYYNNEGDVNLREQRNAAYGGGALEFLEIIRKWREDNKLEGLETRQAGVTK